MTRIPLHLLPGGLELASHKAQSTGTPIATPPLPDQLVIPLSQHKGTPARVVVEPDTPVLKGQLLAEAGGAISAPIHAPTSGIVRAELLRPVPHWSAMEAPCLLLEPDGQDRWCERPAAPPWQELDREALLGRIRDAGLVGLGGAGFPTDIKLAATRREPGPLLIVNGAECEPYITADDMLMRERADQLVGGVAVLRQLLQPARILVAVENDKPQALAALQAACRLEPDIEIVAIPAKYPSGDAGLLIRTLTGIEIPSASRAAELGIFCCNVGTLAGLYTAIVLGRPLISRITTLTGQALARPGNVEALIGTPVQHLLRFAGLDETQLHCLIQGGPLMGHSLHSQDVPLIKTTNCLIAGTRDEFPEPDPVQACIRCGLCSDVCPVRLLPQQLYWHARSMNHTQLQAHNLADCIECGACAFVCPSAIPLVQYYRAAKDAIASQQARNDKAARSKQRFEQRQLRLQAAEEARQERRRRASLQRQALAPAGQTEPAAGAAAASARTLKIELSRAQGQLRQATRTLDSLADTSPDATRIREQVEALQRRVDQLQARQAQALPQDAGSPTCP